MMKMKFALALVGLGALACNKAPASPEAETAASAAPEEAQPTAVAAAEGHGEEEGDSCPPGAEGMPHAHKHGDHQAHMAKAEGAGGRAPVRTDASGSRVFGAELAANGTVIALADVVRDSAKYNGKVVRTEGTITKVCQAMGCWMEMRADGAPNVRVPTAGHSFFLPQDVAGHRVTVEGTVKVQPLDEETKKHLESEGAEATGNEVSIAATSIVVQS